MRRPGVCTLCDAGCTGFCKAQHETGLCGSRERTKRDAINHACEHTTAPEYPICARVSCRALHRIRRVLYNRTDGACAVRIRPAGSVYARPRILCSTLYCGGSKTFSAPVARLVSRRSPRTGVRSHSGWGGRVSRPVACGGAGVGDSAVGCPDTRADRGRAHRSTAHYVLYYIHSDRTLQPRCP